MQLASNITLRLARLRGLRTASSLQQRDFRLLWQSTLATHLGDRFQQVAMAWLIYELTNSPLYLGIYGFTRSFPSLVISPLGGAIADRWQRRTVLLYSQASFLLLAVLMALLAPSPLIQAWHILAVAALIDVVTALDRPSRQALVPDLVGDENLTNAVALNSAASTASRIIGPSLAGIIIATLNVGLCFAAQALAFAFSSLCIAILPKRAQARAQTDGGVRRSIAEGLRYTLRDKTLFPVVIMAAAVIIFAMPYVQFLPVFARDMLSVGPAGLGWLMAAAGTGALMGALLVASLHNVRHRGLALLITATALGALLVLFSASRWFALSLVILLGVGMMGTTFLTLTTSVLLSLAPPQLRGRVMSIYMLTWGLISLGSIPLGIIASQLGTATAIALFGATCSILTFAVWLLKPQVRHLH